jgi:REP element-mobilizing transposase RayT
MLRGFVFRPGHREARSSMASSWEACMSRGPRLEYRDYGASGLYFVTICANFKNCIFGSVSDGVVQLSELGKIVRDSWLAIPDHFAGVLLHESVVMPNHLHGIIQIVAEGKTKSAQHAAPLQRQGITRERLRAGSVSVIVRSFKAAVTRRARAEMNWRSGIWQHGYFDRVIRDGEEFSDVTRYIAENPMRWEAKAGRSAGLMGTFDRGLRRK